jgi:dipeptidyl aminopeptidase/acylaminoacyl peptidase
MNPLTQLQFLAPAKPARMETGPEKRHGSSEGRSRRVSFEARFRKKIARLLPRGLNLLVVAALVPGPLDASPLRRITVEDCVRTRRVVDQGVAISPDGSRVAYVVKAPDVVTNRNNHQLYIRDLKHTGTRENGRMVAQADQISQVHWLGREQVIARIATKSRKGDDMENHVVILNATTGAQTKLAYSGGIEQYSANADGSAIVFSVKAAPDKEAAASEREKQKKREERGYAIRFGEDTTGMIEHVPEDEIYLATRTRAGKRGIRRLRFSESGHPGYRTSLGDVQELDLSPDGKYLLFVYAAKSLPASWSDQPFVRHLRDLGSTFYRYVLGLYEIDTGELRLGFDFPGGLLHTNWSDDGWSYSVVGPSPYGTDRAGAEAKAALESGDVDHFMGRLQHVFTVDRRTRVATMVVGRDSNNLAVDVPLGWKRSEGPMLVRTDDNTFAWMVRRGERWEEDRSFSLPGSQAFLSSLSSDGRTLVGVNQTSMAPPDIFALHLATNDGALVTDLNPEYREIDLGQVEPITWTNGFGSTCAGLLIKPAGYEQGKRYPMVFVSAPVRAVFVSDAPYTTAYAPQLLASAGFVVLMSQYPMDNRIPKGQFPGEMRDAYNWMSMVESGVDMLAGRGMVDPDRVGLAGFSRTAWLTDFTLTHSSRNFVAASSADSGIYTYGAYFTYNSLAEMRASETQVGGPPYGETFQLWLDYAAPFNARNVRAAVLMEYTGTAEHGFEFFTALNRLGKAVELYRYPKGKHPLDTPRERTASLQRNVDWFRFWIENDEGTPPFYDAAQYARWRAIREASTTSQGLGASLPEK